MLVTVTQSKFWRGQVLLVYELLVAYYSLVGNWIWMDKAGKRTGMRLGRRGRSAFGAATKRNYSKKKYARSLGMNAGTSSFYFRNRQGQLHVGFPFIGGHFVSLTGNQALCSHVLYPPELFCTSCSWIRVFVHFPI
jgi:hypothetical protein